MPRYSGCFREKGIKVTTPAEAEIRDHRRFGFGANWSNYLKLVDGERISEAEASLRRMFGIETMAGQKFLDIGSGSGLFSLAARRLGAEVFSFDYDPQSVACTEALRQRFYGSDEGWRVHQGSVLDGAYLADLGQFDYVYSWGVLHHTGAMWQALENVVPLVGPGGKLFIAIYNDQGWLSHYWGWVKRIYNSGPLGRSIAIVAHAPYLLGVRWAVRMIKGGKRVDRGMSLWYDMLDWLGGYPFETATPSEITDFYGARGFTAGVVKTCGRRHGCNEFVLRKR